MIISTNIYFQIKGTLKEKELMFVLKSHCVVELVLLKKWEYMYLPLPGSFIAASLLFNCQIF